jgi:hypothetical protein
MLLALSLVFSAQLQAATGRTVLATVLNSRNQPIVDVEVDDFEVRESSQPQEVLSVHIADYPIALLIDNGADAQADLDAIKAAAARFITKIGNRPVAVWTCGGRPTAVASFTDEQEILLERVGAITGQSGVGTASTIQAMANAADTIRGLGAPFSSIVVLSARGSGDSSAPTALISAILDSRAIVHVVEHRPPDADQGGGDLQALAAQTRGRFTSIYSSASYQVALDRLADQLASELMIDYIVPDNAPPKQDVTVGVKIPGARVVGMGVR